MKKADERIVLAVDAWFDAAVQLIDERFGAGYAKRHPALIGGFLQACAGVAQAKAIAAAADEIDGTLGARLSDVVTVLDDKEGAIGAARLLDPKRAERGD